MLAGSSNTSSSQEVEGVQKRPSDLVLVHPSYQTSSWAKHDVALVRVCELSVILEICIAIESSLEVEIGV